MGICGLLLCKAEMFVGRSVLVVALTCSRWLFDELYMRWLFDVTDLKGVLIFYKYICALFATELISNYGTQTESKTSTPKT